MIDLFINHKNSLNFVPFSIPILRHILNIEVNEKQKEKNSDF